MTCNPYAFTEEENRLEGLGVPDFDESMMELFNASSSEEEEFFGFQAEDKHFGVQSRGKHFHHRGDKER